MTLWTPLDLTSVQLVAWYRVRDPSGVVPEGVDVFDGTKVTNWYDRSGMGNHLRAFPSYSNTDTIYTPGGLGNGLAAVRTSGIYYGTGFFGPVSFPAGRLGVFGSLNQSSAQQGGGARLVSIGNVSGGNDGNQDYSTPNAILLYNDNGAGTEITTYFGPVASTPVVPNTPIVVGTYYRGSDVQGLSLNGTEVGTLTRSYDNTPLNLGIGSNGAYNGSYWVGALAEFVFFNGPLSDDERYKLEGYIAWNNGTQGSLPAGHPYAAAPPTSGGGVTPPPVPSLPRRRIVILGG